MFHTDGFSYETYFDSNWYPVTGDFYVLILIDLPAAASQLFYIKFTVETGSATPPIQDIL